ncbi:MAG: glutamine synthetase family protein [Deinococcota bacterium]
METHTGQPSEQPLTQPVGISDATEAAQYLTAAKVQFLRLQFSDILGVSKSMDIPARQFDKALAGDMMFDGSSIDGFTRIDESDMLLRPDFKTLLLLPDGVEHNKHRVARIICDICQLDGNLFQGSPRWALQTQHDALIQAGFDDMMVGVELEFFLFDASRLPNPHSQDGAGYFDLAPTAQRENVRYDIVDALTQLGIEVESSHHEGAPGQHEIGFRPLPMVQAADTLTTTKLVIKQIAATYGLHATFMPKPLRAVNGSGMHTHVSLKRSDKNAFFDTKRKYKLSETAHFFIGGILQHAQALLALCSPTVNSYKRLAPGYEAPTSIAWSVSNRSAMLRVPMKRGVSTRAELRMPDPSCNPYLAFAVIAAAGLDGIQRQLEPPPPIERNIFEMTVRERRTHKIKELPATLREALNELRKDKLVQDALGSHIYKHFHNAKTLEFDDYRQAVHAWELERYLLRY